MKTISFIFLIVLAFTRVSGQDFTNPKQLGDKAFRNKDYYEAAYYYKKAAEGMNIGKQVEAPFQDGHKKKKIASPDNSYVSYMLAESYRLYENYLQAEGWYNIVLNGDYAAKYPLARLWYGVCLRANQHFDESIDQLQQFIAGYKGDSRYVSIANKEIANCRFAKQQYKFPVQVDAAKMQSPWNSDGSNYAIVKRDQNYWYTSSRSVKDDKKHLNGIYQAKMADAYKPVMIDFKNDEKKSELEYGTPSFNPAGDKMYFTRWYKDGSKTKYGIYTSQLQNGEWAKPEKLNTNVNADGFKTIQPFITADGKRMFFASNKPGGQGGTDIWVSDLDKQGNPVNSKNLGRTINSPLDEEAPYYDQAEKKLIYSSKGFLGLGGFDLYESAENAGQWSAAVNMGYPINSAKDDLYYYPDNANKNKFYVSSDRASECCLDLFEVYDKRYELSGLIVDCDNHKALSGTMVSLVDSLSKQTVKKLTVNQNGRYLFSINTQRPYSLVVEKRGYFTKIISVPGPGKTHRDTLNSPDICLQAFKVNKPIALKNVLYDFNSAELKPQSKTVLDGLVMLMRNNPKIKVELSSYTDGIGSAAYNKTLSQKRAQECVNYIISKGISGRRIFAKGYGEERPIAPNTLPNGQDNPAGRQLNRRTEFTVLKAQ